MRHNLLQRSRKHLAQLFRGRQEHTRRQRGLRRLLELEALEDRTLPSVLFTPSSPTVPIHNPDAAQGGIGVWRPVEPQITVNPKDPANVILTSQNGLEVSTDGGATFGDAVSGTFVAGAALGFPQAEPNGGGDTRTVFDSNGNLFWANLSKVGSNISIYVTQVDPQSGTQIGNTVLVDNPPLEYLSGGTTYQDYDDKVSLAADGNGNLYMAWSRGTSSGWEVLLSKGTNTGQNWSTPVVVSSSSEGFVWPTSVAVDSGGDVFVAYHSEPSGITSGQVLVARYDENLNFIDKTNPFGGEGTAVRRSSYPTLQWPGGLGTAPAAGPVIIADPTNDSVYVFAVNDPSAGSATGDPADIIYARSTGSALSTSWAYHGTLDSGANSNSTSLEILPTAAIDKYGDIVVAWYDGRNGGSSATSFPSGFTDGLLDVYAKYSTDRGQTWSSAFRVNDSSNRLDLGTSRPMDYFGIDLYGNTAYVAWAGNTRNASGTVTGQQVYTDAFSLKGSLTVTNDLGFAGDNYITIDKLSNSELTIIESGLRTYAGLYEGLTSITVNGSTLGVEVNLLTRLGTFTSVSINTNETAGESSTVDLEQSTIFSTITVSLGSGTDTVDMGTLNHSFAAQFESDEIINGNANGSDTLEIDEGNHNGGSTWTIDDSSVQTNIFQGNVRYSQLKSLKIDGGRGGNTFNVLSTAAGTSTTIDAGSGGDAVMVGDANHNLGDVKDLTVDGTGNTTLEVDDRGTYVPPLSTLATPGVFVSYLPLQTQFTIDAGQLTRSAQAQVNLLFAPYVTYPPPFTTTIHYGDLASLTVDGGPALLGGAPTAYHVLSTQGTNAVILKTSAIGSDAVIVGGSHNLGDVTNLTVNGNGITTLEVDDRGTYVPPLSALATPGGFLSYIPLQTQFTIDAGQLTRSAQALVNLLFAPYVTYPPPFTTTIHYGDLASLTVDGGPAVVDAPTNYYVRSTQGTNAVILKTSANGSDAVIVGDASHNLGDVTNLTVSGNGKTTLEVDDRGTYIPPLSTLATPGGFLSYIPLQTQFTIDAGQLTRSAQALVNLLFAPYFTYPPPFTTTIQYGGLASLTVDGGPAVGEPPTATAYYVRSTQGTNAVIIKTSANGFDAVNVGDANNTLDGIHSSLTVEGQGSNTTLNAYDTGTSSQEGYGVSATQINGNPAIQITRTPSGSASPTQTIEYTDIGYVNVYGGSGQDLWAVESTSPQTQSTALYSGSGISHNPNEIIVENAADVLDDIQGPVAIHGTVYDLVVAYDGLNTVGHTYTLTTGLLTRDNGASNISISYNGIGEFVVATANNPYSGHTPNTVNVQSLGTVFAPIAVGTGDTVTVGQNGSMANILGDVRIQNTAGQTPKQIILDDSADSTARTITLGSDPNFGYAVNGLANASQGEGIIGLLVDPTTPVSIQSGPAKVLFQVNNLTNAPALSLVGNAAGTNTLEGPNTANTWKITGANAGTLDGAVSFTGMQSLLGGAANDAFQFQTGGSLSGTLNGGGGTNTLDYSSYIIDKVIVDLLLGTATGVDGGANNGESNIQNVTGGQGDNLLVGDANANVLIGGTGRNIIIGGGGSDQITGGGGDNILIGGTTAYDNTTTGLTDLEAIFAVWTDPTLTIGQRSQEIKKGIVVNGQTVALNKSTVFADNAKDSLIGGTGINWFFVDSDDTINNGAGPGANDTITHV